MAGRFIVLEGIDGAGTTTQTVELSVALRKDGRKVVVTREPSGRWVGQLIREVLVGQKMFPPAAVALLFAADRLDHLEREIKPALAGGEDVISDRYLLSSLAY